MELERYIITLTQRISISDTRKIIDAIHDGTLEKAPTAELSSFGLKYPT